MQELQGPKVRVIQGTQLPQAMEHEVHLCMLQLLFPGHSETKTCAGDWSCLNLQQEAIPTQLTPLLSECNDLFLDPTGLPPSRGVFDHRIPLKPDAKPINIRPYRYPLRQKDVIEKLV